MKLALKDIRKVLILGSGTMGLRIGLQSALSGFDTVIYDIHESSFVSAKKIQQSIFLTGCNTPTILQKPWTGCLP